MDIFIFIISAALLLAMVALVLFCLASFTMNTLVFGLLKAGAGKVLFCDGGSHYFYSTFGSMGVARWKQSRCAFCGEKEKVEKKPEVGFNFRLPKTSPKVQSQGNVIRVDFTKKNR